MSKKNSNTSSENTANQTNILDDEGTKIMNTNSSPVTSATITTPTNEVMEYAYQYFTVEIDEAKKVVRVIGNNPTGEKMDFGASSPFIHTVFNAVRDAGKFGFYTCVSPTIHFHTTKYSGDGHHLASVCLGDESVNVVEIDDLQPKYFHYRISFTAKLNGNSKVYSGEMITKTPLLNKEWVYMDLDLDGYRFVRPTDGKDENGEATGSGNKRQSHTRKHNALQLLLSGYTFVVRCKSFGEFNDAELALQRLIEDLQGEKTERIERHNEIVNGIQTFRREWRREVTVETTQVTSPVVERNIVVRTIGETADPAAMDPKNVVNGVYSIIEADGSNGKTVMLSKQNAGTQKVLDTLAARGAMLQLKSKNNRQ